MLRLDRLKRIRQEGSLCDAVLRVGDRDFNVHKLVLSCHSDYFWAMFTRWDSLDQRVYNIPDVSPEMMDIIIHFMYTDQIKTPISMDEMETLLTTATYLLVDDLVSKCWKLLEENLSPDNCLRVWQFADAQSLFALRDKAFMYAVHHFEDVVFSPSGSLLHLTREKLSDILENDKLNIKEEKIAFQAIWLWLNYDPCERMQHLVKLLPKVRLALVAPEYFMENIIKSPYVSSLPECQPIITQAMNSMQLSKVAEPHVRFSDPFTRPRLPYSILFTVGGFDGESYLSTVESYDSKMDSWKIIPSTEELVQAYHGTVFLDGLVYIIGGIDSTGCHNSLCTSDPLDGTWSVVSPMYSRRGYVSVAVLDGCIYAMGGSNNTGVLNTAECYEPSSNQWRIITSMHEPRVDASAATLNDKIYICGGFNGQEYLVTAECYDPHHEQWTLIEPMHVPRAGLGVTVLNNRIFAVGGYDGESCLQSIEAFNPQTNSWSILSPMHEQRSNFGIGVMDDRLYVMGGYINEGITTSTCEYYDVDKDEWFEVQNMNISRSAFSCCVLSGLPNISDYITDRDGFL